MTTVCVENVANQTVSLAGEFFPRDIKSDCFDKHDDESNHNFNSNDFIKTEGQFRRESIADSELECSKISEYLFVSGSRVASSYELLRFYNIKRVVNCCCGVVNRCPLTDHSIEYLSLNMVDGREEDIGWFACELIQFVERGRQLGVNTLIHCEKGISRSCSLAISFIMWDLGERKPAEMYFI